MNNEVFIDTIKSIKMPYDMKRRITKNCFNKTEELAINKNKSAFLKRPAVAIAITILCITLASATVFATSGKLQGYFRDIKNFSGAITGTVYEQATDEIEVRIIDVSDKLTVEITLLNIDKPSYNCSEAFGINSYSIIDSNNNTVVKKQSTTQSDRVDDTVLIDIPLSDIKDGAYTLFIEEFISSKKADQPLIISGNWEIGFAK